MGSVPGSGRYPGGGRSNPVQCSCLEDSMCRGACWATVHEVAKGPHAHTHTHTHIYTHTHTHSTSPSLLCIQIQLSFPSVPLSGEVDALTVNRDQTYPLVQSTPQALLCPLQVGCVHRPQMGRGFASPTPVQFSLVIQSHLTLCDPMNRSTPGLPVHHQLPEFTQTHAHRVGDAIQPSHPLSSPSPPAPNPSQNQGLFQ